jgi:hypothetical protein
LGFLVAAVFFVKFWRTSDDPFFLLFGLEFALMGIEGALVTLFFGDETGLSAAYLFRLASFCSIISGIIIKNRKRWLLPGLTTPVSDPPSLKIGSL